MLQQNLPPLRNINNLRNLNGPDATSYCQGYGLPVPNLVVDRQRAIAAHIGCRVNV